MSTSCSSNNDFSHYKKPFFSIEFTAKQLGVDIRLNNIPVFNNDNTGFMTLDVPVNQYIINGNNEVEVITFSLFDDEDEQQDHYTNRSSIEVSLYIREDDEPTEKRKLISKVFITPGIAYLDSSKEQVATFIDSIDNTKNLISVTKDATILHYPLYGNFKNQVVTKWTIDNITSSLPHWQWQDGEKIPDNDTTYQSLLLAYTKLHTALLKKDINAVKKISLPRSRELAIAYHLHDENAGFEYSALGKDIDHPTIKLHDKVFLENMKLEIFGNEKLARIMNGADTHPIAYVDHETGQLYLPQFKWQKNKNDEWVLIR